MEKRFFNSTMEIREEGDQTVIRGYAAVFDAPSVDLGGFTEYIRKGAFSRTLKETHQKALWNHNSDYVLGNTRSGTLKLYEDDHGLAFEIIPPDTQMGRDVVASVRRGDIDGNSFGFQVRKQEWDETDPSKIKRYLEDVELFEVSPTAFPAYPETSIGIRSSYQEYVDTKEELLNEVRIKKIELLEKELED
jgi:HK97 family phage prohead protease